MSAWCNFHATYSVYNIMYGMWLFTCTLYMLCMHISGWHCFDWDRDYLAAWYSRHVCGTGLRRSSASQEEERGIPGGDVLVHCGLLVWWPLPDTCTFVFTVVVTCAYGPCTMCTLITDVDYSIRSCFRWWKVVLVMTATLSEACKQSTSLLNSSKSRQNQSIRL